MLQRWKDWYKSTQSLVANPFDFCPCFSSQATKQLNGVIWEAVVVTYGTGINLICAKNNQPTNQTNYYLPWGGIECIKSAQWCYESVRCRRRWSDREPTLFYDWCRTTSELSSFTIWQVLFQFKFFHDNGHRKQYLYKHLLKLAQLVGEKQIHRGTERKKQNKSKL